MASLSVDAGRVPGAETVESHGPCNGFKRDERTTTGDDAEQTSNTARGAPGIRQLRGDYACVFFSKHTQGCGAVVAPAFRAPSFFEGGEGMKFWTTACPGPHKEHGR
jgi:hypothetical protein